jgi:hypothetical protein
MQEFGCRFGRDGSGGFEVSLHDIPKKMRGDRQTSRDR